MNQTNFFKMLGRVKKGEVVRLNAGRMKKLFTNMYLIDRKEKSLLLEYRAKGTSWRWSGLTDDKEKIIDANFCVSYKKLFDIKCKRHEILKVLFEILGVEIEEL